MQSIFVLSLAAAALAAPTAQPQPGFKLPISKRTSPAGADGVVDPEVYLGLLQYTLNKYGVDIKFPGVDGILKKRAIANEPLKDQYNGGTDELYYGPVGVGTDPTQTFLCDFDTGSADFFVPGPKCSAADGCTGNTRYDQGGQNEGNTTSVTYGSGTISGENYFDNVTVAGLTAHHQNVISLTQATGFSGSDASSLMGMAFDSIANSGQPTYFDTLMSQGTVTNPEFSFYLGRHASGTGNESQLTLGGRDSSKYTGSVHQVPVIQKNYWRVALDKVLVNGQSNILGLLGIDPTAGQAAIDTGTTLIIAPYKATVAIYSLIPGAIPIPLAAGPAAIAYAYPCSETPNVAIQFAGKDFAINPLDFNIGTLSSNFGVALGNNSLADLLSGNQYCLGAIAGEDISPPTPLYVVGDTFIKNWYSIFNFKNYNGQPSVSFAKSV